MLFGALLIWTVAATQQILTEATTCGGEFSNTHGQIKSPNYPEDYPSDTVCKWVVSAPEGSIVELRFLDFDVEDWFGDCENDIVQIFDGSSSQSTVMHDALCGRNNPGSFVSTGRYMTIMLKSGEESQGRKGFLAEYSTRPAEAQPCVVNTCGGEITDATPCKIQSPGYPHGYAANLNCSWLIRAPVDGGKVFFQFTDVKLNFASSLCKQSNVTLYDGDRPDPQKIIYESVCDMEANKLDNKLKPFSSAGSTMLVVLRTSRASSQKHGFSAQFNIETGTTTTMPSVAPSRSSSSISTTSVLSRSSTTTLALSTTNKATIAKTTDAPTAQADEDVTSNIEKSASTSSVLPSASTPVDAQPPSIGNNAAALSGLVIGGIVFLVVVVFAVLLIITYVHWKRQNHRFNIRLGQEDARSDVNSLITDSRETVYKGKKYGKIVRIQDDAEAFNPL